MVKFKYNPEELRILFDGIDQKIKLISLERQKIVSKGEIEQNKVIVENTEKMADAIVRLVYEILDKATSYKGKVIIPNDLQEYLGDLTEKSSNDSSIFEISNDGLKMVLNYRREIYGYGHGSSTALIKNIENDYFEHFNRKKVSIPYLSELLSKYDIKINYLEKNHSEGRDSFVEQQFYISYALEKEQSDFTGFDHSEIKTDELKSLLNETLYRIARKEDKPRVYTEEEKEKNSRLIAFAVVELVEDVLKNASGTEGKVKLPEKCVGRLGNLSFPNMGKNGSYYKIEDDGLSIELNYSLKVFMPFDIIIGGFGVSFLHNLDNHKWYDAQGNEFSYDFLEDLLKVQGIRITSSNSKEETLLVEKVKRKVIISLPNEKTTMKSNIKTF